MIENPLNRIDADWEELVREHFATQPLRDAPTHNTRVTGIVIANAPNGVLVDIGIGVPALLDNLTITDDAPSDTIPHWTKPIGATIVARVGDDSLPMLRLHQYNDDWTPMKPPSDMVDGG
ncbi:hypothetical protein Pla22_42560 [Rubripirellula amarantea]|uniref:S1 motif domain-containing protein n=1 Tax=Rubripirellula amarantea TaxID=2527999 RepID=A0A5C5WLC5_9BACT|nr:hypothetical protein [Rubripirellula amarantea]TWT51478.1 hypothetical protein Pla22_42560 [Rubripirellula amarantea]